MQIHCNHQLLRKVGVQPIKLIVWLGTGSNSMGVFMRHNRKTLMQQNEITFPQKESFMKKSLLLRLGLPLLLSIIVGHLSYAQSSWIWQNPLPQGNALLSVSCTDANTGTAVGYCGSIVRTTDGGANWAIQTSGTRNNLQSVLFTDANTGTAVGDSGTILRTTNGGATWTSQSSGTTNSLLGVHFTDANTGTAVGINVILRTTNGGTNWTSQLNGTAPYLSSVSFTDADKGCISGSDKSREWYYSMYHRWGLNWTNWINQMQSKTWEYTHLQYLLNRYQDRNGCGRNSSRKFVSRHDFSHDRWRHHLDSQNKRQGMISIASVLRIPIQEPW